MDFVVPEDHRVKIKENEKKDKYLDLARELKNYLLNLRVTVIPIVISALGMVSKCLLRELEVLEIGGRIETNQNFSITKISQNTEKSPGHLRRHAVSRTPVKDAGLKNSQETIICV